MSKMTNRSHLLLVLPLIALPVFGAISLYYIAGYHVWPLSRDQWHMYAPYFERGLLETMLSPMSTHRHIFPFLFFHLDMALFHGLNHFLVACGAFFDGLVIFLLLQTLFKEKAFSFSEKVCLAIFITAELVWLLNIAQLGWGFMSTQYYLAIFTFLLAIYSAHQFHATTDSSRNWILLAISCGVISTFSFGMGILVWPCLLYFLWIWRSNNALIAVVTTTLFVCLLLFFVLPGGSQIGQAMLLTPQETLRFTFQLTAGPVYYLLKSWRLFEADTVRQIASVIGITASGAGILLLVLTLKSRSSLSPFKVLCHALMMLGLGSAAMITFIRSSVFLDVWVDRYQIWGTLFWTGFLPLLYLYLKPCAVRCSQALILVLACLPLLALPSQLDMGSRLYEYKTRVQEALLFYQAGIPDKQAAQDALHWSWEHKLPFLFYVLEQLKIQQKNIYYQSPATYLGQPLKTLSAHWALMPIALSAEHVRTIRQEDLLTSDQYPALETFSTFIPAMSSSIAGYQITAQIADEQDWEYAVSVNKENVINGLGIHIHHSSLPRPSRDFMKRSYNLFAVIRYDGSSGRDWYMLKPQVSSR